MTRRTTTALTLTGVAAGLTWAATARRDARAIAADPRAEELDAADLQAETLTVRGTDGTELAVDVYGPADAPIVVLAHGWLCSSAMWAPQVRDLAADHRVIAYDQRGHGRSVVDRRDALFEADVLADDLAAVIDATVPAGRRAVVVGHSMGAMGAVAWAGNHGEQVRHRTSAVLLLNTGISRLVADSRIFPAMTRWPRLLQAAGLVFQTFPLPLGPPTPITHRGLRYVALSRSASPAQVAFCERMFLSCPRNVRIGWGRMMNRMDLDEMVAGLDVPTTVVSGSADRLTPAVHAERLAKALPRLDRLVELPGVGHMSTVEAPGSVTAEIRRVVAAYATDPVEVGA